MPFQHNRSKRSLIDGIVSVYKWLFELMDDSDKEESLEHPSNAEIITHNSIGTLNK